MIVEGLTKTEFPLEIYELKGFDFKIAVGRVNDYSCNFYFLDDKEYVSLGGLTRKDGKLLEESEILTKVLIEFYDCE